MCLAERVLASVSGVGNFCKHSQVLTLLNSPQVFCNTSAALILLKHSVFLNFKIALGKGLYVNEWKAIQSNLDTDWMESCLHLTGRDHEFMTSSFCIISWLSVHFYRQTNRVNELQGIVGYYKFQCIQSVMKIYTILICSLETHFQLFFRINEINMENLIWSFISMLTFEK